MAGENAHVQLAPDGTGKNVQTLELQILQGDGSLATVELQVIGIVNPVTGKPLSVMASSDVQAILDKLDEVIFAINTK